MTVGNFATTGKILDCLYPPEEFRLITAYGPLGYGKSTLSCKIVVDVLKIWYRHTSLDYDDPEELDFRAWEMLKQFIVFHPEQFFQKLHDVREISKTQRIPSLIWDDAGLWLYALDWNDPFIIRVGKYMNVARSRLGSVIMTTPTPDYIFKKIRKFPQAINLSIYKVTGKKTGMGPYLRQAKAYLQYYNIVKGYRVRGPIYYEDFSCLMPDWFYEWYKPLRDAYEKIALDMMMEEWNKTKEKSDVLDLRRYKELQVPKLTFKA